MRTILAVILAVILAAGLLTGCTGSTPGPATTVTAVVTNPTLPTQSPSTTGRDEEISVTSPAIQEGGTIPARHTCAGQDTSPALAWKGVPSGTRTLALVVDDPDAGNYLHWVVAGIDPAATGVAEGAVPRAGVVLRPWSGPCPPSGTHTYRFTVYALDRDLDLGTPDGPELKERVEQLNASSSALGTLRATFSR
jgi:Raf kinase inhibitor-like YbhB/YbcL family protein